MSFSSIQLIGDRADPDRVYYNATIVNTNVASNLFIPDPVMTFGDSRQTPVIADSSKYNVAVEKFSLNGATKTLPLFIPLIQTGGNINQTIYTVTVACGVNGGAGNIVQVPIIWEPENRTTYTTVPTTATPAQSSSDYYYCYTYSHWINLVNKALFVAWTGAIIGGFGTKCPFFEFDETTGLFSLNQDANTCMVPYGQVLPPPYNVASATAGYTADEYTFVGMNTNLEQLLTNFASTSYAGKLWGLNGQALPAVVIDFGLGDLTLPTLTVGDSWPVGLALKTKPSVSNVALINPFTGDALSPLFVRLTQDYVSTGSIWSPIASIIIGTSQLPVRNEAMANPVTLGSSNIGTQNGAGGAFQKVLIETPINAVTADIWRGWVLYEPLVPTFSAMDPSHQGVTDIDLQIYWRNRLTNAVVPMQLSNAGSMSIRLLFKRRD